MVLTMYAYSDMTLPQHLETIFEIENLANVINSNFLVSQVVLNGWMAVNEISHGYKHSAILNLLPTLTKTL